MSVSEVQTRVKASIWQAIAQSGVDLSALPQQEQDKLVGAITGRMLQEMDGLLAQTQTELSAEAPPEEEEAEKVLWAGRPFLSISMRYQITDERVRVVEGLLGKQRYDVELVRIQDVDHKQTLTERVFSIGDVYIRSHDPSHPELTLNNVSRPEEVHEVIRRAVLKARQRHNLSYREEM